MGKVTEQIKSVVPVLLLAAGNSSRHSKHKLLTTFNSSSLLKNTVEAFKSLKSCPIILVTGAHRKEVMAHVENYPIKEVFNQHWKSGMGSSIATGVAACLDLYPSTSAIMLSVCDQAYLNEGIAQKLFEMHLAYPSNIIISKYLEGNGPPSIFPKQFFDSLMRLEDDYGAKSIVRSNLDAVLNIPFKEGHIDLDSDQDFESFFNNSQEY